MKRRRYEEKKDNSLIYHILFFLFVGFVIYLFFFMMPNKEKGTDFIKQTKDMYKDKVQTQQHTNEQKSQEQVTEQYIPPDKKYLKPFQNYKYEYQYKITTKNNPKSVTFIVPIPSDEPERQYITNSKFMPKPTRVYHDGVNNMAEYIINNPKDGIYTITLSGNAKIRTYDLQTARILNKNIDKEKNLSRYLVDEKLIEANDSYIQNIASQINTSTREEYIQSVYKFLQTNMKYQAGIQNIGAKRALQERRGKCSEYSAAMVALLRAKKIPARVVTGNMARSYDTKHEWVEVYFDRYGWVTFDPTYQSIYLNLQSGQSILLDAFSIDMGYIISSRNGFTPWNLTYTYSSNANSRVSVSGNHIISKI